MKEGLRAYVESLTEEERNTLRAIINGKKSKRTISPEQRRMMQKAKEAKREG